MLTNKLTIIPIKLDPLINETSPNYSSKYLAGTSCIIKTATAEISFFDVVEESIIKIIMKELNSR